MSRWWQRDTTSEAQRDAIDRAVAEIHGSSGVLVRWSVYDFEAGGPSTVRLASGPHKGKQGYVFAKWVFPVKGKAQAKPVNYSLVSIYDTNQNFTFMCKCFAHSEMRQIGL